MSPGAPMTRLIVIGATSAIAQAVTRRLATPDAKIVLVARSEERLIQVADDLRTRSSCEVRTYVSDLDRLKDHPQLVSQCWESFDGCDILIIAHGTLPDQHDCETSVESALAAFQTNGLSTISLLTIFADRFEGQGHGSIVVISSVAGDRGRRSNYVYGSAKAALTVFTSGLRNRLAGKGVHVLTVKPGLVDTPMTAAFKKGPLWARPDQVAAAIAKGIERSRDIVYAPWFWRVIMQIIRLIPERVFKKTNL